MNEEPSEEWVSYQQGIRNGREESKARIEQLEEGHEMGIVWAMNRISQLEAENAEIKTRIAELEADMRRLEQIYNRDQVAQVFANEIETIFDRWALELNATERY